MGWGVGNRNTEMWNTVMQPVFLLGNTVQTKMNDFREDLEEHVILLQFYKELLFNYYY